MTTLANCPVVILAGGLGTRLLSVVSDRPKALAPIGDRPFLELQIELLQAQGARHFVLCVGHRAAQIQDHFGNGSRLGVQIDYSIEPETLLGTAGALRLARRYFDPHALVLNGDTYLAADYRQIVSDHLDRRARHNVAASLTLTKLEDTTRFGTVILDPSQQFLTGFREKDQTHSGPAWLNAGAYVIERSLIARIPPAIACSLERDLFPSAIADGLPIAAHLSSLPFFDIGTADDFHRFRQLHAAWQQSSAASSLLAG